MDRLIAIDPGASGGMAYSDEEGVVHAWNNDLIVSRLVEIKASSAKPLTAFVEDVPFGMSKEQSFFAPMAKLQRNAGKIEGAIMALGIRMIMVDPRKWQKALSVGTKAGHGDGWKRHLRDEAQRRFPDIDVTLKTADALLILDYARQGGVK